jgi:hypothetical protein
MPKRAANGTVGNVGDQDLGGLRGIAVSSITQGVQLLKQHVGMSPREIDQVIARAKGETVRGRAAGEMGGTQQAGPKGSRQTHATT